MGGRGRVETEIETETDIERKTDTDNCTGERDRDRNRDGELGEGGGGGSKIEKEIDRWREGGRQTDRQTGRQTDRQTSQQDQKLQHFLLYKREKASPKGMICKAVLPTNQTTDECINTTSLAERSPTRNSGPITRHSLAVAATHSGDKGRRGKWEGCRQRERRREGERGGERDGDMQRD